VEDAARVRRCEAPKSASNVNQRRLRDHLTQRKAADREADLNEECTMQSERLSTPDLALSTKTSSELEVFGPDRDALGMDGRSLLMRCGSEFEANGTDRLVSSNSETR
jgi:hypothetical protein